MLTFESKFKWTILSASAKYNLLLYVPLYKNPAGVSTALVSITYESRLGANVPKTSSSLNSLTLASTAVQIFNPNTIVLCTLKVMRSHVTDPSFRVYSC